MKHYLRFEVGVGISYEAINISYERKEISYQIRNFSYGFIEISYQIRKFSYGFLTISYQNMTNSYEIIDFYAKVTESVRVFLTFLRIYSKKRLLIMISGS
jgi:hypothetical protein